MNEQTRTKVAAEDQGTIGIKCLDVSSQIQQAYNMPAGIYISEVTSGGAAENAGLKSGYVLTSFDGHSITSTSELKSLLHYYSAGETVEAVSYTHLDVYKRQEYRHLLLHGYW